MWRRLNNNKELPTQLYNKFIMTKVDDGSGARNEQKLKWDGKLWWNEGGMYVYYQPTHYQM